MDIQPAPALIFQSTGIPGLIKLNDTVVGELSDEVQHSLSVPITPSGTFYISFIPLIGTTVGATYCPVTRKLVFHQGKLLIPDNDNLWDSLSIVEWPGKIFEITLNPIYIPITLPSSSIPKTIDRISHDFDEDGEEEIATLFTDPDLHLVIEDIREDRIVFECPLPYGNELSGLTLKDVTGNGAEDILVRGPVGATTEFMTVVSYRNNQYQVIFNELGHSIHLLAETPSKIQLLQRVQDTVEHGILYTFSFDGSRYLQEKDELIWYLGHPQWPETPETTARAFMEALLIEAPEEAMGYLSGSLKDTLEYEDLEKFFGRFASWVEPKYPFPSCGPTGFRMGAVYDLHSHYRYVKLFCFEMIDEPGPQGRYKVHNITIV